MSAAVQLRNTPRAALGAPVRGSTNLTFGTAPPAPLPPLVTRRANDVLRAAGLEPAALSDQGVHKDLVWSQYSAGNALSPILVVTGHPHADIAAGYHRASLVYQLNPYGLVSLKLA